MSFQLTTGRFSIGRHHRVDIQLDPNDVGRWYVKIELDDFPDVFHKDIPVLALRKDPHLPAARDEHLIALIEFAGEGFSGAGRR